MKKSIWRKGIVLGIMLLFIGTSIVSSTTSLEKKSKEDILTNQNEDLRLQPWWDYDWNCRRNIAINHNYIETSLSNFPVLVVINSTIGAKCDGGDSIRFISMDNSFEYYYEIEKWNGASGNNYVWVNISDTIFSDSDFNFFMYYNNSDSSDNQNPGAVWNSYFKAIYHLTNWNDSTSNSYDLIERTSGYPNSSVGIIGNCAEFDGADPHDLYRPNNDVGLTITGDLTLSGWINLYASITGRRVLPCFGGLHEDPGVNYLYDIAAYDNGEKIHWLHEYGSGSNQQGTTVGNYLFANNWIYLVVVRDSVVKEYRFYINGDFKESISYSFNPDGGYDSHLSVGGQPIGDDVLEGKLDEQRISNIMRNASWIKASYHTMNQTPGFISLQEEQSHPDIVYVDNDFNASTPGWGYDHFDSIQDGVDAINESGTVYVYSGTYYENVVVDKTINLTGEDRNSTIIDGGGSGTVVSISADWVNFSGFTIQNSGSSGWSAGIEIHSNHNIISNNIVTNNWRGVNLKDYSSNNTILDNTIHSNNRDGIDAQTSNSNFILNNTISNNNEGIELSYSSNNNTIQENIITNNYDGIEIHYSCNNNTILGNNIISNVDDGIDLKWSSNDNYIYHNNFINNTHNAYDECTNTWYSSTLDEGNYYDDYNGTDGDGDGIGDTPYNISGGSNQDLYPLMFLFGPPHANFTFTPPNPTTQDNIQFNDTSIDYDGVISSWHWNFGDGNISNLQNPTHQYSNPGTYTVTLNVTDDDGATSNTATVSINVTDVNDPPVAVNDVASTPENTPVLIDILANDYDPDGAIDPTTVNIVTNVSHGSTSVNPTSGMVTYTPDLNYFGPDYFTYTVKDNEGATSNVASVSITVYDPGRPVAVDDFATTPMNTPVVIDILANDYDPDGAIDPTTVNIVTNVSHGSTSVNPTSGMVTYTPNLDYYGPDSFYYTVKDNLGWTSNVAKVSITVVGNYPPNKPDRPSGPTRGKAGLEYTYCIINATDPDGDDIWANFSWGDGSYSGWIGPNASGEDICASHAWERGNYEIRVKLKDEWGLESPWSDPLPITIPRNKPFIFNFPMLSWLFERFPNAFPILRHILGS